MRPKQKDTNCADNYLIQCYGVKVRARCQHIDLDLSQIIALFMSHKETIIYHIIKREIR